MAPLILLSLLVGILMSTASPTPELTKDSSSPADRFHLTSKNFPSTPPAYYQVYDISCSQPECYLQFRFTDLDIPPTSQIKIRDEGTQITLFHFIQNYTYVSARPLLRSQTSSISILVILASRSRARTPYIGFKVDFDSKVIKAPYNHSEPIVPWERTPPATGCPEFHQGLFGEMKMYTATSHLQCSILIKGIPRCNMYLRVVDMSEGSHVAEVILGNNSASGGSAVRLDHLHQFVWSKGGLFIRFIEDIGAFPKRLIFAYGCYGKSIRNHRGSECFIESLGYGKGGVECNDSVCLFTNGSSCDGIYDCPNLEDESPLRCPQRRRSTPPLLWITPRPTKPTYTNSEPTEHAAPNSPFIYLVYALVPLLILIMIGCIFYRMTLRARDVFGRRLVYPNASYPDDYEAPQPPPAYDVALTHPKPEVDPGSALPSYDESNADIPPPYEEPGHPGDPTSIQMENTPDAPLPSSSTVSSSGDMPRLLMRYSQIDISPPEMQISPEHIDTTSSVAPCSDVSQSDQQQPDSDAMSELASEENGSTEPEQQGDGSSETHDEVGFGDRPHHGTMESSTRL